jgi:hypothetical protein
MSCILQAEEHDPFLRTELRALIPSNDGARWLHG